MIRIAKASGGGLPISVWLLSSVQTVLHVFRAVASRFRFDYFLYYSAIIYIKRILSKKIRAYGLRVWPFRMASAVLPKAIKKQPHVWPPCMTSAYGFAHDPRMAIYLKKFVFFSYGLYVWPLRMTFVYDPSPHPPIPPKRWGSTWMGLQTWYNAFQSQNETWEYPTQNRTSAVYIILYTLEYHQDDKTLQQKTTLRMTSVYDLRVWPPRMTSAYDLRVWLCVWLAYGTSKEFFWYKLLN